jgi:hypothetical protein
MYGLVFHMPKQSPARDSWNTVSLPPELDFRDLFQRCSDSVRFSAMRSEAVADFVAEVGNYDERGLTRFFMRHPILLTFGSMYTSSIDLH